MHPPSKSYTHRAFIMAFLADGNSNIKDPLYSEDTLASLNSCISIWIMMLTRLIIPPVKSLE